MEKQMGRQFDGLALEPDRLRPGEHWRMPQAVHQLGHGGVQAIRISDLRSFSFVTYHRTDERMEILLLGPQMGLEKFRRKLDGDELMCFPCAPGRGKRRLALMIKCQHPRAQFHPALAVGKCGAPGEVKAQLDATGMKTARPIEFLRAPEVMPFKAEAKFAEVAEKRAPARAHLAPGFG